MHCLPRRRRCDCSVFAIPSSCHGGGRAAGLERRGIRFLTKGTSSAGGGYVLAFVTFTFLHCTKPQAAARSIGNAARWEQNTRTNTIMIEQKKQHRRRRLYNNRRDAPPLPRGDVDRLRLSGFGQYDPIAAAAKQTKRVQLHTKQQRRRQQQQLQQQSNETSRGLPCARRRTSPSPQAIQRRVVGSTGWSNSTTVSG